MDCRSRAFRAVAPVALAAACHCAVMTAPLMVYAQGKRVHAAPASAGTNLIAQGRSQFEDQRYEESIQTLSAALLRPNTAKKDKIEIYRLLAYNYIVLQRKDEAESAVRGLYCIDPDFALASSESPRFRDFFADVKKRWVAEGKPGLVTEEKPAPKAVTIKHSSPAEATRDQQIDLTGEVADPDSRTSTVVLHYRSGSKDKFVKVDATFAGGRFKASIPPAAVKPPLVEYYIEAVDQGGLPVASRGDAAAPLRIAVPAPAEGGSIFSSPWFWGGAGAVAVGAALGVFFLTRKSDSSPATTQPPNPGTPTSRVIIVIK